ncbi:MEDS domain-containing protein [Nitrosomonas supralitoralis]|uniref:MEDS domain-containing protein n=1 Tax=Nitrosomonas supralitoralis TaxID=2116706 RepID=A0A2P7NSU6_9PROT|nr:MEDS domain-containing protein [Nitrosomonas supralitoralis]PSJ16515.1 hypothetical protein C7H79_13050 [Nitrosomonas supralitoralis]
MNLPTLASEGKPGVKLAGSTIERSAHACAFFHTAEEYYNVLLPFIKDGFEAGDKAFHVLDESDHAEHFRQMENAGIPVAKSCKTGQLEVRRWEEAYLKPGYFSQDDMLELLEGVLKENKIKGYPMTRLIANMEWACKHEITGVNDIVKYETRLNHFLPNYDDVVVCTYDLTKHSASVVMDVLRTHPYVLIGGMLHENPYFVNPEDLLAELEARGS